MKDFAKDFSNLGNASQKVYRYLRLMEDRQLDEAKKMLNEKFKMIFPGNSVFYDLDDLIAYSKLRHKTAVKSFEKFEEFNINSYTVVYVTGLLSGQRLDGTIYQGVRFIDRFTLYNGKFTEQYVWNDMGYLGFGNNQVKELEDISLSSATNFENKISSKTMSRYINFFEMKDSDMSDIMIQNNFTGHISGGKTYNDCLVFCVDILRKFSSINFFTEGFNIEENNERSIIYVYGFLNGKHLNGNKIKRVRYLQRIESFKEKIISHFLWDDLGEHGYL